MKSYEIKSLVVIIIFGLAGAWITETFGEYIALLFCAPPPAAFYLYSIWKHEKPVN